MAEGVAAVSALEEAAVARAADDRPWLSLQPRHPRIDDIRIAWLNLDVHGPDAVVDVEHLPPGLPAILCLEHSAFRVSFEGVAVGRDPGDVRVGRMDPHRSNLSGVIQADELPVRAA